MMGQSRMQQIHSDFKQSVKKDVMNLIVCLIFEHKVQSHNLNSLFACIYV